MTKQNAGTAEEESPFGQEKYDDLWGRPGYLIRRLHQIHVGLFSEACGGLDLTAVQYAMLSVLFSGGGNSTSFRCPRPWAWTAPAARM